MKTLTPAQQKECEDFCASLYIGAVRTPPGALKVWAHQQEKIDRLTKECARLRGLVDISASNGMAMLAAMDSQSSGAEVVK